MAISNDQRKGTKGGGDSKPKDVFARMNQGSMSTKSYTRGLMVEMGQKKMAGTPGKPRPGKTAPSVARAMGQPGR